MHLRWKRRRDKVISALAELDADIVCLQEVDRFEEFYGDQLRSLGYKAVYRRRAAHKKDGCVIAWKVHKFDQVSNLACVEFNDLVSVYNEQFSRDNVGVYVFLQVKDEPLQPILVANTHLFWNPLHEHVKLAQISYFLQKLREARIAFAHTHFGFPPVPKDNNGVECEDLVPLVLGGDFNATPLSRVYKFMFPNNNTPDPPPGSSVPSDTHDAGSTDTSSTSGQPSTGAVDPDSGFYFESAPQNGEPTTMRFVRNGTPRLLVDGDLFKIGKWLRAINIDVAFVERDDRSVAKGTARYRAIFERARNEQRVLVTRNRQMTKLARCPPYMRVGNQASRDEAFKEIIDYFQIPLDFKKGTVANSSNSESDDTQKSHGQLSSEDTDKKTLMPMCNSCHSPIIQVRLEDLDQSRVSARARTGKRDKCGCALDYYKCSSALCDSQFWMCASIMALRARQSNEKLQRVLETIRGRDGKATTEELDQLPPRDPEWFFFPHKDSNLNDIAHVGRLGLGPGPRIANGKISDVLEDEDCDNTEQDSILEDSNTRRSLTVEEMKRKCIESGGVAFNTNGWIKSKVVPQAKFSSPKSFRSLSQGLYVLRSYGTEHVHPPLEDPAILKEESKSNSESLPSTDQPSAASLEPDTASSQLAASVELGEGSPSKHATNGDVSSSSSLGAALSELMTSANGSTKPSSSADWCDLQKAEDISKVSPIELDSYITQSKFSTSWNSTSLNGAGRLVHARGCSSTATSTSTQRVTKNEEEGDVLVSTSSTKSSTSTTISSSASLSQTENTSISSKLLKAVTSEHPVSQSSAKSTPSSPSTSSSASSPLRKVNGYVKLPKRPPPLSTPHNMSLQSAYYAANGEEPENTNVTEGFEGCLDYIIFTPSHLRVESVHKLPQYGKNYPQESTDGYLNHFLPNQEWPSDHLALKATFSTLPRKTHTGDGAPGFS